MTPRLSIIISHLPSPDLFENVVQSVHAATKETVELVVVGTSVDPFVTDILQRHGMPSQQVVARGHDVDARGAEHARGTHVCFSSGNILFGGHSLDRLLDWVLTHPRTIVGPRTLFSDGRVATSVFDLDSPPSDRRTGWSWQPWLSWLRHEHHYADFCRTAMAPELVPALGGCLLMSAHVWHDVGAWRRGDDGGIDHDWWRGVHDAGVVPWFIPGAEVHHQQ